MIARDRVRVDRCPGLVDLDVPRHELRPHISVHHACVDIAGDGLNVEGSGHVIGAEVTARALDARRPLRLFHVDVPRGRLELDGAVLATSFDVRRLRANVEVGTAGTRDAEPDVRPAETNVGTAADRDPETLAGRHLDDDLVAVPAAEELDPSLMDELADAIVVRERLELDVRLFRVGGLDLDLPRGNLEVEPDRPRRGVGLRTHQRAGLK